MILGSGERRVGERVGEGGEEDMEERGERGRNAGRLRGGDLH